MRSLLFQVPAHRRLHRYVPIEEHLDEFHALGVVVAALDDGLGLAGKCRLEVDFHAGVEFDDGTDLIFCLGDVLLGDIKRVVEAVALFLLDMRAVGGEPGGCGRGLEHLLLEFLQAEFFLVLKVAERVAGGGARFPRRGVIVEGLRLGFLLDKGHRHAGIFVS